jgi:hypothetical protein
MERILEVSSFPHADVQKRRKIGGIDWVRAFGRTG